MKYQVEAKWLLHFPPNKKVERTNSPTIFNLDETIEWIKKNKPILWTGSVFSVPSGLCSGYSLTKSLFDLTNPIKNIPELLYNSAIEKLLPRWPLEAIFNEFELHGYDLSSSILKFFSSVEKDTKPNLLHNAIVNYYQSGLSQQRVCITTNWDNLIERAFFDRGINTIQLSIGQEAASGASFERLNLNQNDTLIYHPHGSFLNKDVICCYKTEQAQINIPFEIYQTPILFLGYSGYEPSLYFHLYRTKGLWCIRNKSELDNPLKRRLLSRPGNYVYIGDLQDILIALKLIPSKLEFTDSKLESDRKVFNASVANRIFRSFLGSTDLNSTLYELTNCLLTMEDDAESFIEYILAMRNLINHIRDRNSDFGIVLAILAALKFKNSEQLWINLIAFIIRNQKSIPQNIFEKIMKHIDKCDAIQEDSIIYNDWILKNRTKLYKNFINDGLVKIEQDFEYWYPSLVSGDMAAMGEFLELWAFKKIQKSELEEAENIFNYAADCYYLRGLWNAGKLNEYAANNIEKISSQNRGNSLLIVTK